MIGKKKVVTVQYPDCYKKLLLQNRRRDSVIYIYKLRTEVTMRVLNS